MITIEQGESTPYVNINPAQNKMILKGNSFISNPHQFYAEVKEWGRTFKVREGQTFGIDITMGYYSTSNIQLLNLFLKTLNANNKGVIDVTFYLDEEEEEDLEETMLSLVFNTGLAMKKVYL